MNSSANATSFASARANGPDRPAKATLLIVDDEHGPRRSLQIIFEDDYRVLVADGAREALRLARQEDVDVALLDIRMPEVSGVELLDQLKQVDSRIEVVMLTAYESLETARQALRLGACDYLAKPFDVAVVRVAVARAVERRSLSLRVTLDRQRLEELQGEIESHKMHEAIVRGRGEIYASVVHDLNNPLAVIAGLSHIVNEQLAESKVLQGAELDQLRQRLASISRHVHNCVQLSRRYLSFLRQRSEENQAVSVNQTLTDLRELIRNHPALRRSELEIMPLAPDIMAKVNGIDLLQILVNLTVNALQCSELPRRVLVRADRRVVPLGDLAGPDRTGEIFLNRSSFLDQPPLAVLSVEDDGPGIPHEILPRIFDPGFTTKALGHGVGLGLAIVQRLIREARGGLHVLSRPGLGTSVSVYLRAHQPPPPPAAR
jgi:two-component system sensor histidine kinase/response regulator